MKACLFGHRRLWGREREIRKILYIFVEALILAGYRNFIVGVNGEFDKQATSICTILKRKYEKIYEIKVFCAVTSIYQLRKKDEYYACDMLNAEAYKYVDFITYPIEEAFYKQRLVLKNQYIIDASDLVICYVRDEYKSGAYKALQYAQKKNKVVVNIEEYFSLENL